MGNTFTYIVTIFIFLIINSCSINNQQLLTKVSCGGVIFLKKPNISETPMILELRDSIVTDENPTTKLSIQLFNNATDKVAIIPSSKLGMFWSAYVLLNDSIFFYHQSFDMAESIPSETDYYVIEPFSKVNLSFNLNISEYSRKELMFHGKNIDYGAYKIQIVYKDIFDKHFNAISGIHSNKVSLLYKNN